MKRLLQEFPGGSFICEKNVIIKNKRIKRKGEKNEVFER
jgi:hypothetical protein